MELIKNSSEDEIEKISDRLESYLIDISSYMRRVVSYIFFFRSFYFFILNAPPSPRAGDGVGGAHLYDYSAIKVYVAPKGMVFSCFGHTSVCNTNLPQRLRKVCVANRNIGQFCLK